MTLQSAVAAAPAKVNLLDFDRPDLEQFFTHLGEKPFRGGQLLQWAHQRGIADFEAMSNIAKPLRERLQAIAEFRPPQVVERHESDDGTRKWVLQLDNGNHIETVFIPDDGRYTLCVSSQIGCTLNCSFCATARQGFNRNLSVAEIIGQLWLAEHSLRTLSAPELPENSDRLITNIVFMGMGEPLLNFDNVVKAIRLMQDDFAYGLSWRRITVSTAGVVPMIDRLKQECAASLAVSLHAPDDALRDQLVPLNRKYPIAELLAACRRYLQGENRRKITFEYVLIKGVNDTPRHAHALVKLLRGIPSKVNLIPFNPFPAAQYQCSTAAAREQFADILTQAGYITLTRKTRGDDISAACGQLAGRVQDRTRRSQRMKVEAVP